MYDDVLKSFGLSWERDYGIDHRTGWSISVNGHFTAQLEPWLIVAVVKTLRSLWHQARDRRSE